MLHRGVVLPQHTHTVFSLSAFVVGAAGVQHWERAEVPAWALGGKFSLGAETARSWAPDLVQCPCAMGRHGGTILTGWFLGSSEQ